MLSTTRERRSNAGNRMSSLLDNEENDDFYTSAYGGFADEADDAEYSEEDAAESDTDSDISIDENDEVISDDEEENKKRTRRVVTKAYKEPQTKKIKKDVKKHSPKVITSASILEANIERKQMRESTTLKSLEVKKRSQALKSHDQNKRKSSEQEHKMTQEQLLEEAKITELKNLKSLEMFQRLELEKKKSKVIKRSYTGPMIRYLSTTMPAIEVIEDETGKEENKVVGRCTRNFITYPDEATMKQFFNFEKPKPINKSTCIVTRLPARYFDPLTKQPSANLAAFRIIREAYYTQLEKKVDPKLPHVARWLEWRKQVRAAKQNSKKTH